MIRATRHSPRGEQALDLYGEAYNAYWSLVWAKAERRVIDKAFADLKTAYKLYLDIAGVLNALNAVDAGRR